MSGDFSSWKFVQPLFDHSSPEYDVYTVAAAREEMQKQLKTGAVVVNPITGESTAVHKRSLTKGMARVLAAVHYAIKVRHHAYVTGAQISNITKGGDYGKLKHWQLLRQEPGERPENKSSQRWVLGNLADDFVSRGLATPASILVFQGRMVGVVDGPKITLNALLGDTLPDLEILYLKMMQRKRPKAEPDTEAVRP